MMAKPHTCIEGLPEGSYAMAAKYLQTSGQSVIDRLNVAEALLNTSVTLTPPPEQLVLQHTTYALTCDKPDFDDFRARYWRLLGSVHARVPSVALPGSLAVYAVKSLGKGGEERDACMRAIDILLKNDSLRPNLESLGSLAGAVIECTVFEPSCEVSQRVALTLLVEYDDLQRRAPNKKRLFSTCCNSVMFPVLRSAGVVRQAGDIVLRHGLFPNVTDIMNFQTYYSVLYNILTDVPAAPHPELLPELLRFLMRTCRDASSVQRNELPGFPRVGKKRAFAKIVDPPTTSVRANQRGLLTPDISIPMRFFSEALKSLMANIENGGAKCAEFLQSVEGLTSTAAELRIYRPSFDDALIKHYTLSRSRIKDEAKKAKIPEKHSTVGSLVSKLLEFISSELLRIANETEHDIQEIVRLAKCSEAVLKLVLDSSPSDLPRLINAVCTCAGRVHDSAARNAFASLLSELFQTHLATRKIPELFQLFCTSRNDDCVLDELYNMLAVDGLQEVIVDCLRSLPHRHADFCVQHLLRSRWKEHPKATTSVLFLLSLIIEVVDLPTLKTILPSIAASIEPFVLAKSENVTNACGGLFFYASVGLALAKNSLGPSSPLGKLFSFDKIRKATSKIANEHGMDITFANCELRFFAAWTQFLLIEYTEQSNTALPIGRSLLAKFGKLSLQSLLDEREPSACEEWTRLILGKTSNAPLLRIFAGVCNVLDHFVDDNDTSTEGQLVGKGLHVLLSLTIIEAHENDVIWDSILETNFARRLLGSVLRSLVHNTSLILSNGGNGLKSLQKLLCFAIPKSEAKDILKACKKMLKDERSETKLPFSLKDAVEVLSNSSEEEPQENSDSLNLALFDRLSSVIAMESEQMKQKDLLSGSESRGELLEVLQSVNSVISNAKDQLSVLEEQRDVLSLTAVVVCKKVLYGPEIDRHTYLQMLSVLSQDKKNAGIMGIRKHLICRLERLYLEMEGDTESQPCNNIDRLVSVGLAITCGAVRIPIRFNWMEPRGGIIQAVERASRFLGTIEPDDDDIILAAVSIRAVASILWRTRQNDGGFICGNNACNRGVAFKRDVERGSRITEIWNTAEYAVATCSLVAQYAGSGVELGETLLNALSEMMFVDGAIEMKKKEAVRTRMYYGLIRAICLVGRKSNLNLSALRCIRAALRSGCVDERCGRTISRYFEKVSGPPVVGALVDLAVALVDVDNPRVRAAMEPGAASLIRQIDEKGRNEALRACDDNARDVLRSLDETYRQDFEYGRN